MVVVREAMVRVQTACVREVVWSVLQRGTRRDKMTFLWRSEDTQTITHDDLLRRPHTPDLLNKKKTNPP